MELWIRSQDRLRFARMDSVIINARNKKEITSNYSYTSDGFEKDIPLGEYKTKERALEVLDEIQDKLNARKESECSVEYILIDNIVPVIYEMPSE